MYVDSTYSTFALISRTVHGHTIHCTFTFKDTVSPDIGFLSESIKLNPYFLCLWFFNFFYYFVVPGIVKCCFKSASMNMLTVFAILSESHCCRLTSYYCFKEFLKPSVQSSKGFRTPLLPIETNL
jgi:hypothetical protein